MKLTKCVREDKYPELPLQPGEKNTDAGVYQTIRRSCLHKVAARPALMPCAEILSWLISHANVENRLIKDENGKAIASFQPSSLELYYKFPKPETSLTDGRVLQFAHNINSHEMRKGWWITGKAFRSRRKGMYPTINQPQDALQVCSGPDQ